MKLLRTIRKYPEFSEGAVAAIGNFDGVHLGHQYLLDILRNKADNKQLPMIVIIFEPQAREFFQHEKSPPRLSRFREKVQLLERCGVDYVLCLQFNKHLANMQPEAFAQHVIFYELNIKHLVVGEDFRFGHNRAGDYSLLQQLGKDVGCVVEKCPDHAISGERISSTNVRRALACADFKMVEQLLGRKFSMSGKVIYGAAKAREWGMPTANLKLSSAPLPLRGVFCVRVARNGRELLSGVANIGQRPTVDGTKQVLEVHIFDFNESLYGERIEVIFIKKLRDEIKFPSIDALISQIKIDVSEAENFFLTRIAI
ncbi:MAG: bifunctional riboflavin kinase/FAD synthetase [Legionellaceae bacterium]|nr:bifunctional riboflavin kinase/FAD synthetase [Legionellaceae bacterium]